MSSEIPSREQCTVPYVDQLPYEPYPVQDAGAGGLVRVRAGSPRLSPTGTGKTLIAEAALFEALHTGRSAYYMTPRIPLLSRNSRRRLRRRLTSHARNLGQLGGLGFNGPEEGDLPAGLRRDTRDSIRRPCRSVRSGKVSRWSGKEAALPPPPPLRTGREVG